MNPLTNIKNVQKLNDRELELGIIGKKSWHDEYKDSAWIFIGGLPFDLTEGDILCVFSQYGEIVNINLVRDGKTGKSKGFAFLCFEDQRSTVLSVDNLNGIKILERTVRVDHVKDYKVPKERGDEDDLTKKIRSEGCAPKLESSTEEEEEGEGSKARVTEKKAKKKKKKKDKKRKKRENSSSNDEALKEEHEEHRNGHVKVEVKKEKFDPGYDRALNPLKIKGENGREQKPHASHSRGHRSKSHSHSPVNSGHKKRSDGRHQRHDSDSDNEPTGSYHSREPQHRDSRGSDFDRNHHSSLKDGDSERGGDKDYRGSKRREGSIDREQDRSRDRRDRHLSNRREGSREQRRYGSSEQAKHRERDRGFNRDEDYDRNRQSKHYSSKGYDRGKDHQR